MPKVNLKNQLNKIKSAGNKRPLASNSGGTKVPLSNILNGPGTKTISGYLGKGVPAAAAQAQQPQPNPINDILGQGNDQAKFGAGFLNNGASQAQTAQLTENAKKAAELGTQSFQLSQDALGRSNNFLQNSLDPQLGSSLEQRLQANRDGRLADIERLFATDGEIFSDFRSDISDSTADSFISGLTGSKADAVAKSDLAQGLIQKRAAAELQANEASIRDELGQIDQTRGANLTGAQLASNEFGNSLGAASSFLNASTGASNSANSFDLGIRGLGADVLNAGVGNQLKGTQLNADIQAQQFNLAMEQFLAQNNVNQQTLENIIGQNTRRQDRKVMEELLGSLGENDSGGGFFESFGGLFGAALPLLGGI